MDDLPEYWLDTRFELSTCVSTTSNSNSGPQRRGVLSRIVIENEITLFDSLRHDYLSNLASGTWID